MNFRRDSSLKNVEVNLTPLIDVVFLLLIFFMVSTTFDKQSQLQIVLPEANSADTKQKEKNFIDISINAEGEYFVNQQALIKSDEETLKNLLKKTINGDVTLPVVISADGKAPHQSVITVLDVASQLGLSKMTFATQQGDQ
jgi:biopolymer transport protein ExbD